MPAVTKELQERRTAEYAAMGLEYIPAEELERREIAEQEAKAEEIRIKKLHELCDKKGLDFETENQKVFDKRAAKAAKQAAKAEKAAASRGDVAKSASGNENLNKMLGVMSLESLIKKAGDAVPAEAVSALNAAIQKIAKE